MNQSQGQPTLETPRLILRPFTFEDVPSVTRYAGAREISMMTLNIPHPYDEQMAREWIEKNLDAFEQGKAAVFAIVSRDAQDEDGKYAIGGIGLHTSAEHSRAEIGYWLGVPFWNRGYVTEATQAIVDYGFETLNLR